VEAAFSGKGRDSEETERCASWEEVVQGESERCEIQKIALIQAYRRQMQSSAAAVRWSPVARDSESSRALGREGLRGVTDLRKTCLRG
jgi:hypothetical protein